MSRNTLEAVLVGPLSDVYCTEHGSFKPFLSDETKERIVRLLADHLDEVGWRVDRLEMVFELLRESSCGATCASSKSGGESVASELISAVRQRSSAA